ncbi:MAG TPA: acyl-ACP--UDP-N-acetylglucosamine O-acyltransferase [Xanthobacteraceae bacterium]|nr:acyl-ACP--UDP-N-acetylglucosamine O-acyltransferase [Xanthobacteraceae bacterium]
MPLIDPSARVEDGAELADDVEIGPFCTVGPGVKLGVGVRLISHVVVAGLTEIGDGTVVHPFAALGTPPQSIGYKGEPSRLKIGRNCVVREHVTMNTGTRNGHMETVVGDNGFFMVGSHVAHDCIVGKNVVFANNATLAGHVTVGDFVFIGGLSGVHQFTRVGEYCMVGGLCGVHYDLIPFGAMIEGRPGLGGLNVIGLKRRGFTRPQIHSLRAAYRELFYGPGALSDRRERVAERYAEDANVMRIVEFVRGVGKRRITVPADAADHASDADAA